MRERVEAVRVEPGRAFGGGDRRQPGLAAVRPVRHEHERRDGRRSFGGRERQELGRHVEPAGRPDRALGQRPRPRRPRLEADGARVRQHRRVLDAHRRQLVAHQREAVMDGRPGRRGLAAAALGQEQHRTIVATERSRVQEEQVLSSMLRSDGQLVVEPGERDRFVARVERVAEAAVAAAGRPVGVAEQANAIDVGTVGTRKAAVEPAHELEQAHVGALDGHRPAQHGNAKRMQGPMVPSGRVFERRCGYLLAAFLAPWP